MLRSLNYFSFQRRKCSSFSAKLFLREDNSITPLKMLLQRILYYFAISFVRAFKWLKLQWINQFSGTLVRLGVEKMAELGVVLHFKDDEWTKEKEKQILAKCAKTYDKLVHIRVHKPSAITRICHLGSLGLGESYMDGEWDLVDSEQDISNMLYRIQLSPLMKFISSPSNRFLNYLEFEAFNMQTREKSRKVIDEHYDLGNDLYESFLDPWMQYTCGYWANADNLNDAQLHKMDLIARKLELRPGMRVLDIGCGWGNLCKYFTQNYGVHTVGVTISEEQVKHARNLCEGYPLVEIRLQDYRDLNEKFDRIVCVGMIEHVGFRNYREYMQVVHRCLKDDGLFLLHTIGVDQPDAVRVGPWVEKYIFPNSMVPRFEEITEATRGLFVKEDWHNFGQDYVKTLEAWIENFNRNWSTIEGKYGKRFYRMWMFYLTYSASIFKARKAQLWQIVLSKDGLKREYRAAR